MLLYGIEAGVLLIAVRLVAAASRGTGARLKTSAPLRWWPLAAGALALQLWLAFGSGLDVSWRTPALVLSQVIVVLVALANIRYRWMPVVVAGLCLNLTVMLANGGLMPVSPETLSRTGNGHVLSRVAVGQPLPHSKDVILPVSQMRLSLLSDTIPFPHHAGSFSIGDAIVGIGILLVLQGSFAISTGVPSIKYGHDHVEQNPLLAGQPAAAR